MAGRGRRGSAMAVLAGVAAVLLAGEVTATGAGVAHEVGKASGPVVVVGIPGVTWNAATPTDAPALASVGTAGATAQLSVRSTFPSTCAVDGWLTLSSSRRTAATVDAPPHSCPPVPSVVDNRVTGWTTFVAAAAQSTYEPHLGRLGDQLAASGTCATAVGHGAGVALARADGTVANYLPSVDALDTVTVDACPLTIVDAGAVDVRGAGAADEATQVRAVDGELQHVLDVVPFNATVVVVSLANARTKAQLEVVAMKGPGVPAGGLTTDSTRHDNLVLLTDITPTIYRLVGLPDSSDFVGMPLKATGGGESYAERRHELLLYAHKVDVYGDVTPPFFIGLVSLQVILYVSAGLALRRRLPHDPGRGTLLRFTGFVALACGAVPIASFLANLVPWWRWGPSAAALVLLVLGLAVVIAVLAQAARPRGGILGEAGVVAGITAVGLGLDILTGGQLQTASLMGYSPIVAGRLYGFGNVAFALFLTASLLATVVAADRLLRVGRRRDAGWLVAAIGVVTLLVDGLPMFGSDFGGMPAIAVAFGVLLLGVLGLRVTWVRLVGMLLAALVIGSAVATLDWLRPAEQRSHLGRFVQQVLDGDLWSVAHRKLDANVSLLTSSSLGIVVPFALLFLVIVLLRPPPTRDLAPVLSRAIEEAPTLRAGLWAFAVGMVLGFGLNDSGIAIPAVGIMLAFPLVITIATRVLERAADPPTTAPLPP